MNEEILNYIKSHDGNFSIDELTDLLPKYYFAIHQQVNVASVNVISELYNRVRSNYLTASVKSARSLDGMNDMINARIKRSGSSIREMNYFKEHCPEIYSRCLMITDVREIIEREIDGENGGFLICNKNLTAEDYIKLTFNPSVYLPKHYIVNHMDVRMKAAAIIENNWDYSLLSKMGLVDLYKSSAYNTLSANWEGSFSDLVNAVKEFNKI